MFLVWWILAGLITGSLTGKVLSGNGYGVLPDMGVGVTGSLFGGALMLACGFWDDDDFVYTLFAAVLGAIILVCLVRRTLVQRSSRY